jgi:hypothetical protein
VVREGQSQLRPGAKLALREASVGAKGPAGTPTTPASAPGSGGSPGGSPSGKHKGHKPL